MEKILFESIHIQDQKNNLLDNLEKKREKGTSSDRRHPHTIGRLYKRKGKKIYWFFFSSQ